MPTNMAVVDMRDGSALFSYGTLWQQMLFARVSYLKTCLRFASGIVEEAACARTAGEHVRMESLFTSLAHQPELFNNLRHVGTYVLIGAPAPVLFMHRAPEVRESR